MGSTKPIERLLANRWELTFRRRVPTVIKNIVKKLNNVLIQFHEDVELRVQERGIAAPGLHLLVQQVETSQKIFHALVNTLLATVRVKQKKASRQVGPVIAAAMTNGYRRCLDERGKGSFMRIKAHMLDHVGQQKGTMFRSATESIKNHLREMCLRIEKQMKNETEQVFQTMRNEYFAVVVGTKFSEVYAMSAEELKLRRDIAELIQEADEGFRCVLGGEEGSSAEGSQSPRQQAQDQGTGETPEAIRDPKMENGEDAVNGNVKMEDGKAAGTLKSEESNELEGQNDIEMGEVTLDDSLMTSLKDDNDEQNEQMVLPAPRPSPSAMDS